MAELDDLIRDVVKAPVIAHAVCPGCGWKTYVRRWKDGTESWAQAADWIRTHGRVRHGEQASLHD